MRFHASEKEPFVGQGRRGSLTSHYCETTAGAVEAVFMPTDVLGIALHACAIGLRDDETSPFFNKSLMTLHNRGRVVPGENQNVVDAILVQVLRRMDGDMAARTEAALLDWIVVE